MSRPGLRLAAMALVAAATWSCASRLTPLPTGPGDPFPDHAAIYAQAIASCREVKTMRAVLRISGRTVGRRFRATLDAGFAAPARARLELPAPGRPLFVFVADGTRATLLLPRESRVLADAPSSATLEALAGIAIAPDVLGAIVAGCGFGEVRPTGGRRFSGDRAVIDGGEDAVYLAQVAGAWQLVAATRGPLEVRYGDFVGGLPETIRLRTAAAATPATDLTVKLSQIDRNEPLGPEVFAVEIPGDARPMTLDELRQAGPLGR